MKKSGRILLLSSLGWLLLFAAMLMGAVRDVGLDPELYLKLQLEAGVQETSGVSRDTLLHIDVSLANYLAGKYDDPNLQVEVYGELQPAFNARELQHLADCRRLFAPIVSPWLGIPMAVAGVALALYGEKTAPTSALRLGSAWLASGIILAPLAILALWAAIDFDSAFTFFHKILFTNDLWLLNPETDLLIRICPSSMFASMGLRIGLRCAAVLLGLPLLLTLLHKLDQRKRKTT